MAELIKEQTGNIWKIDQFYKYKCTYEDENGNITIVYRNEPCEQTIDYSAGGGPSNSLVSVNGRGRFTPGTSLKIKRELPTSIVSSPNVRPRANRMRFRNFYGENSNGYKLFTQQYFIGLLVGAAVGFYVLPKVLKK